jgi:hypothetical protein
VIADSLQKPLVVVTAHPNTASTLDGIFAPAL